MFAPIEKYLIRHGMEIMRGVAVSSTIVYEAYFTQDQEASTRHEITLFYRNF